MKLLSFAHRRSNPKQRPGEKRRSDTRIANYLGLPEILPGENWFA